MAEAAVAEAAVAEAAVAAAAVAVVAKEKAKATQEKEALGPRWPALQVDARRCAARPQVPRRAPHARRG